MSDGVCTAWEQTVAKLAYDWKGSTWRMQACGMPIPLEPVDLSPPVGLDVMMRGAGYGSYPTKDVGACIAQGESILKHRDVAAGKSSTEQMQCLDRTEEKVLVNFSVTKACEPGKDPNAAGSCKVTHTVKDKPRTP